MDTYSVFQLSLELIDRSSARLNDSSNLKLAHARHGFSRELFIPAKVSLYDLHLYTQKLFGWKDFCTHRFSLRDEDFLRITSGKVAEYNSLCGILFRPDEAQTFDWYWHDFKDDPNLVRCGVMTEGSFFNAKRLISRSDSNKMQTVYDRQGAHPQKKNKLSQDANCLIERLNLGEIFTPCRKDYLTYHSAVNVAQWKDELIKNADCCMNRLFDLRNKAPDDFYNQSDAFAELDSWKASYRKLQRIRENPAAVESRFGLDYENALLHHLQMFLVCFRQGENIAENYNPKVKPFFGELMYFYDKGENWQVRIRCLNQFKLAEGKEDIHFPAKSIKTQELPGSDFHRLKASNLVAEGQNPACEYSLSKNDISSSSALNASSPGTWQDCHGRNVPDKIRGFLDTVMNTLSPVCFRSDGVMLMDDIGGISGFFEFLRTLNGRDKTESRRVRELAEIYGWSEKTDPKTIILHCPLITPNAEE